MSLGQILAEGARVAKWYSSKSIVVLLNTQVHVKKCTNELGTYNVHFVNLVYFLW